MSTARRLELYAPVLYVQARTVCGQMLSEGEFDGYSMFFYVAWATAAVMVLIVISLIIIGCCCRKKSRKHTKNLNRSPGQAATPISNRMQQPGQISRPGLLSSSQMLVKPLMVQAAPASGPEGIRITPSCHQSNHANKPARFNKGENGRSNSTCNVNREMSYYSSTARKDLRGRLSNQYGLPFTEAKEETHEYECLQSVKPPLRRKLSRITKPGQHPINAQFSRSVDRPEQLVNIVQDIDNKSNSYKQFTTSSKALPNIYRSLNSPDDQINDQQRFISPVGKSPIKERWPSNATRKNEKRRLSMDRSSPSQANIRNVSPPHQKQQDMYGTSIKMEQLHNTLQNRENRVTSYDYGFSSRAEPYYDSNFSWSGRHKPRGMSQQVIPSGHQQKPSSPAAQLYRSESSAKCPADCQDAKRAEQMGQLLDHVQNCEDGEVELPNLTPTNKTIQRKVSKQKFSRSKKLSAKTAKEYPEPLSAHAQLRAIDPSLLCTPEALKQDIISNIGQPNYERPQRSTNKVKMTADRTKTRPHSDEQFVAGALIYELLNASPQAYETFQTFPKMHEQLKTYPQTYQLFEVIPQMSDQLKMSPQICERFNANTKKDERLDINPNTYENLATKPVPKKRYLV